MKKPIIGIVENKIMINDGPFMGADRCYANYAYIDCVEKVGGVPISIPFVRELDNLRQQLSLVDGVILTGGGDIDPSLYGRNASYSCGPFDIEIDQFYIDVIATCKDLNKPILGICKGNQAINVAYGGTLIQDIASHGKDYICHSQKCRFNQYGHSVTLQENSFLSSFMPMQFGVNSFHHQAVDKVGEGLVVCALADDGIVESVADYQHKIYGIQWHPEMLGCKDEQRSLDLFNFFINQCK